MSYEITLVHGDLPGSDVAEAAKRYVAAVGVEVHWDEHAGGAITDAMLASLRRTGTGLMDHQHGRRESELPPMVQLRKALGVFANIRPVHTVTGLDERFPDVDIVIVRETTEDIYAHLEHESIPGVFESLKVTTRSACERIARHAFDYAVDHGRKKVTVVHKANIMKKSDGLFLRTAQEVAGDYPDVEIDDRIVDALCMQLILYPERFDVLVCGNLFGDIVADLACGLVGGAANCPSINVAPGVRVFATPQDHRGPSGEANPLAIAWPTVLMLRHLGEDAAADRLMGALNRVLLEGIRPRAIGGAASGDAVVGAVERGLRS